MTKDIDQTKSPKTLALVVYILQIVALLNGLTAIVAVVIGYIKADDAAVPAWIQTHYRWQIKTFWISLLLSVVGMVTFVVIIGYFILLFALVWYVYRIVKGLIRLSEGQPIGKHK